MTKPSSDVGDNGGRCELCNDQRTMYQGQSTYPTWLAGYAGGPQKGTLWVCARCRKLLELRDAGREPGAGSRDASGLVLSEMPEAAFLFPSKAVAAAAPLVGAVPFSEAKRHFIKRYLEELLEATAWNISQAARFAKVERSNFRRLLRQHRVVRPTVP